MTKHTCDEIAEQFFATEKEFGEHKSTQFLAQIVADRNNMQVEEVFDYLAGSKYWGPEPAKARGEKL